MSTDTLQGKPARRAPPWMLPLRWGLSLAMLVFVSMQLASRWEDLQRQHLSFSWPWALASVLGLALCFVISGEGWRRLMGGLGERLGYARAFKIQFSSNLAKYLPGGVWNLVGRVVLCERQGISPFKASFSVLMEAGFQVSAALVVALLLLPFTSGVGVILDARLLALVLFAILAGMHPRLLNTALGLGERLLKRKFPRVPYSYSFMLGMLAYYVVNWLFVGGAFALLAQALLPTPMAPAQFALLAGIFPIAWNVGVFAFFFPGGLGVREAAIVLLLGSAFPAGWPAALALAARLWFTLGEVGAFAVAATLPARKEL